MKKPDTIGRATARYEKWLRRHLPLVEADVAVKHRKMRASAFQFLRATHYRWAQTFAGALPELAGARRVLAVGDLHVENFGTWRDREGRLVWGVNDFDDGAEQPYTYDLVRLTTSALLAVKATGAHFPGEFILEGYRAALRAGGSPCVIGRRWQELGNIVEAVRGDAVGFWKSLERLPRTKAAVPSRAMELLLDALPGTQELRIVRRVAGLGSLGRQRFVALARWQGGSVAREVKRIAPPAAAWVDGRRGDASNIKRLLERSIRCPDPALRVKGQWIVRRLAPDSAKIEFAALPARLDLEPLLFAMGWETANIHLGSASAQGLLRDLGKRGSRRWLGDAARSMASLVESDWRAWRAQRRRRGKT